MGMLTGTTLRRRPVGGDVIGQCHEISFETVKDLATEIVHETDETDLAERCFGIPLKHLKLNKGSTVINYGEGGYRGGYKMGKSWVRNFLRHPSRQGKTFCDPPPLPLLKGGNFLRSPITMANKSSSSCVKTTSKLFVPPVQHGYKFLPPPSFS